MCRFCAINSLARKSMQRQSLRETPPETLSSWGRLAPKRDLLGSSASDRTLKPTPSKTPNLPTHSENSKL